MNLYSDDKTLEDCQSLAEHGKQEKVIFNLYEDILCLKEELEIAINIIEESGVDYNEVREYYEEN